MNNNDFMTSVFKLGMHVMLLMRQFGHTPPVLKYVALANCALPRDSNQFRMPYSGEILKQMSFLHFTPRGGARNSIRGDATTLVR
jgi:hypothetical protein